MNNTREKILHYAEEAISKGGYSAFSFRTVAESLNVKSATIHYHFRTKEELLAKLIDRYHFNFFTFIGEATSEDALEKYTQIFLQALGESGDRSCLCGVLASERGLLSEELCLKLKLFWESNLEWLQEMFRSMGKGEIEASRLACLTFASLEGAILFSRISESKDYLLDVINNVKNVANDSI